MTASAPPASAGPHLLRDVSGCVARLRDEPEGVERRQRRRSGERETGGNRWVERAEGEGAAGQDGRDHRV